MEDGEISGNCQVPRGKRPREPSHRINYNVPNRRRDFMRERHVHLNKCQDRHYDSAQSENSNRTHRNIHSHKHTRYTTQSCDHMRSSFPSVARRVNYNPHTSPRGSELCMSHRDHQRYSERSYRQDSFLQFRNVSSDYLRNRWDPPPKKLDKSPGYENERIESKDGHACDQVRLNSSRVELGASIHGELKNHCNCNLNDMVGETLNPIHCERVKQSVKHLSGLSATKAIDSKISKWLSNPKKRVVTDPTKQNKSPIHALRSDQESKAVTSARSTPTTKEQQVLISAPTTKRLPITLASKDLPAYGFNKEIPSVTSTVDVLACSPSIVSDGSPYATEASFASAKEDSGLSVDGSRSNELLYPGLAAHAPDLSPVPVISTIHVRDSPRLEEKACIEVYQVPSNKTGVDVDDDDTSSDSDTDDEEVLLWAEKMFGVTPPGLQSLRLYQAEASADGSRLEQALHHRSGRIDLHSTKLREKPASRMSKDTLVNKRKSLRDLDVEERRAAEEGRRKKEEAKPLTAAEIRAILSEDFDVAPSSHWVRRSSRQPCKAALTTPGVKALLDKLRQDDSDMVVLKMKKYVSDPDTPQVVIDAVLDALEENTNCEALYIQNFNRGMRDEQVLHLLKVLQARSCQIWCLNIGETYNVKSSTWKKFARGLKRTKVTHMYASEHTIDVELKDKIRDTIRANRKKHDKHCNPENLDVIVQCTHCWWNPVNAKVLRPFLRNRGFEHILKDKEAQGLRGTMSGATLGIDHPLGEFDE